jgi:hypothetical protein
MKTGQVVLMKKQHNRFLQSFGQCCGLPMKKRLLEYSCDLPVRATMHWVVNDESVSFENIMVKERWQREVKYFVETASSAP